MHQMIRLAVAVVASALLSACGEPEPMVQAPIGEPPPGIQADKDDGQWWSADSTFTECFATPMSPADRMRAIREAGVEPSVTELADAYGYLEAVEVGAGSGIGLTEEVWTYYRDQGPCEASLRPASRYE